MMLPRVQKAMPAWLRNHVLHFEAEIERAVTAFAAGCGNGSRVLDAGAGEGSYKQHFRHCRYVGVDLGVGDSNWSYRGLDAFADLAELPLRNRSFAAALNIVTLEHVRDPQRVLTELYRVLEAGGRLLLVVPHMWEEHQQPNDFFRYTQFGIRHLLTTAGFRDVEIRPVGGFFRLLGRRLLNGLQFFPGLLKVPAAVLLAPPALLLPLLEPLDQRRNFTLGYICTASKS